MTNLAQLPILQQCWQSAEQVFAKMPFSLENQQRLEESIRKIVEIERSERLPNGYYISFQCSEGDFLYKCRVVCERRVGCQDASPTYNRNLSFLRWENEETNWERRRLLARCPKEMSLMQTVIGVSEISLRVMSHNISNFARLINPQSRSFQSFYDIFLYLQGRIYSFDGMPSVKEYFLETGHIMYFPSCFCGSNLGFFMASIEKTSFDQNCISGKGLIWDRKDQRINEEMLSDIEPDSYPEIFNGKEPRIFAQFPVHNEGRFEVTIAGYLIEKKKSNLFSIESIFNYLLQRFSNTMCPRPSLWRNKISEGVEDRKKTVLFKDVHFKNKKVQVKAWIESFDGTPFPTTGSCWDSEKSCIKTPRKIKSGLVLLQFCVDKYLITIKSQ